VNPLKMQEMLEQARHMQDQMQEKLSHTVVEASSGRWRRYRKDERPEAGVAAQDRRCAVMSLSSSPADVEMLEDLVTAAFNEAGRRADEAMEVQPNRDVGRLESSSWIYLVRSRIVSICRTDGAADRRAAQAARIGAKSAQRLAFHILRASTEDAGALADAVRELKARLLLCSTCNNITDVILCLLCQPDTKPTGGVRGGGAGNIAVIEKPAATTASITCCTERCHPPWVGPEHLRTDSLVARCSG